MKHPTIALLTCAGLLFVGQSLPGCSSQPPAPTGSAAVLPSFDVKDQVAVSAVREEAMRIIRDSAKDPFDQVRANAVEAASLSPERLMMVIEGGLTDSNTGVRTVAAMAVGQARLTKACPRVRPMLSDPSNYVKSAAIFALIRCGEEVDRTPLASMLLEDPSIQVRSHIAYILGELKDPSALPVLRAAVRNKAPTATAGQYRLFELQAAEAMIKLGDDKQRPVVRAALYPAATEELEATALACQIMGQVQDRVSMHQLVSLSEYKDTTGLGYPPEVQLAIAGALATMGLPDGSFIANRYYTSEQPLVRAQAAYVYGQIGKIENWDRLELLMKDKNPTVRIAAAGAVLRSAVKAKIQ